MVRGPAHGPRVDVVQLAAGTWAAGRPTSSHWSRTGLALSDEVSVLKELPLAIAHGSRNGVAATCERYDLVCALRQILHWRVSVQLPLVFLLLDPS